MLRQMMKRMISGMGREEPAELRTQVVSFVDLKINLISLGILFAL